MCYPLGTFLLFVASCLLLGFGFKGLLPTANRKLPTSKKDLRVLRFWLLPFTDSLTNRLDKVLRILRLLRFLECASYRKSSLFVG